MLRARAPARRASTCRPRSTVMSGRGTITSRTIVSPNSKIEWISSFSPSSIAPPPRRRRRSARSSCSVTNGPCGRPLPGHDHVRQLHRGRASGPTSRPSPTMSGASASATRSVCWIANVFGVTSAKTNSKTRHHGGRDDLAATVPNTRTASEVAIVVPPIVASSVEEQHHVQVRRRVLGDLHQGRRARGGPPPASRYARTRFMRVIDDLGRAPARRPAAISTITTASSNQSSRSRRPDPRVALLPRPHLGALVVVLVVVAQQVQDRRARAAAGSRRRVVGVVRAPPPRARSTTSPSCGARPRPSASSGNESTSVGPASSM